MSIEVALQPWDCCCASSAWRWELLHSTPGEIAAYEYFVLCKSIGNILVLSLRLWGFSFLFFFILEIVSSLLLLRGCPAGFHKCALLLPPEGRAALVVQGRRKKVTWHHRGSV